MHSAARGCRAHVRIPFYRACKACQAIRRLPAVRARAGRWAKKIRGRTVYFGPLSDPDAALANYLDQKDELYAGRKPQPNPPGTLTIKDVANAFLNAKQDAAPETTLQEKQICLPV
jgi:hypothetical protein